VGQYDLSYRLRQKISPDEASLRQAFETWLVKVVLPRLSGEEAFGTLTLEEIDTMLLENIDRWNHELREEGRQEGRQEGLQEGRQEAAAQVLLRLLRLKFGPLEPEVEERVRATEADRLLEWSERVLTAEHLHDVFKD
jgi:flagellar biosynthesis/type III secretory pathway protein FliH